MTRTTPAAAPDFAKSNTISSLDEFVKLLDTANASFGSEVMILTNDYADRIVGIVNRLDEDMSPIAVQMIMIAKGMELKDKLENSLAQIGETMESKLT